MILSGKSIIKEVENGKYQDNDGIQPSMLWKDFKKSSLN